MNIKLSILVPTVPSRISYFYPKIMDQLLCQIEKYNDIELIALFDNKKRSIGKKRQEMIDISQGEYIVFIDDDDRIADDYIKLIMIELYNNTNTDCVVFDSICTIEHSKLIKHCKYGIEFEYIDNGNEWWGKPAHTMVWKAEIVKKHKYKDMGTGEDYNWVKRAIVDIKHQTRIDKVLYFYDSNSRTTSETHKLSDDIIKKNIKLLSEIDKL
jgi:glycosyltransferase involved in cell wall biosynthesis